MAIITPMTQQTSPIQQTQTTQTISAKLAAAAQAAAVPPEKTENPTVPAPTENVPRGTEEPKIETKREEDGRFAALSRKEKEILRRDRDLKEREKLLQEKYKPWEEASQLAPQSKLQALQKLGFTYDDITNEFLGVSNLTPEQLAERKAEEIANRKFEEFQKKQEQLTLQNQQQAYHQALKQISLEVKQACDPEKFPIVNEIKGHDTVTQYIEQTYHATGEILSREQALQDYEDFIAEEWDKVLKNPKIRSKFLTQESPTQNPVSQPANPKPQTLIHKTTVAPTASKPTTWEEKKRFLIEKYQLA
jgi:hypothetical protein